MLTVPSTLEQVEACFALTKDMRVDYCSLERKSGEKPHDEGLTGFRNRPGKMRPHLVIVAGRERPENGMSLLEL